MSVSSPASFQLFNGRDTEIERARPIRATTVQDLALDATWAYARANRRTILARHTPDPDETTSASYVLVMEAPFTFSAGREDAGARVSYAIKYATVKIVIRDAADTTDLVTDETAADGSGSVVEGSYDLDAPGSPDVLVRVYLKTNTGATAELHALSIRELGLEVAQLAPATDDLVDVAVAAGLDHVWTFDQAGTPTEDLGSVGGATLTVVNTVTNYAPTVTGSRGYYDQATQASSANRVRTATSGAGTVHVARTADCWMEAVVQTPDPVTGASFHNIWQCGQYFDADAFAALRFNASAGCAAIYSLPLGTLQENLTALTDTYLSTPTYVAMFWNHALGKFQVYWNNGSGEGSHTSAALTAGSGSTGRLVCVVGGDGSSFYSTAVKTHYAAFHRGTLTSDHRNAMYAAMGF